MLSDYIDPLYFLIALALGLLYTYLSVPKPLVIIKYPTPFNAGKITYVDTQNSCYKYQINKTTCPTDKSKIYSYWTK